MPNPTKLIVDCSTGISTEVELADANRCKIQTVLLKDEIETSQDALLRERQDLRERSARLKKQAARMTETHKRRKTALADQRKEMEHDINTEKKR